MRKLGKIKLFCIPYAGGSANVYLKWKKLLDSNIELCPIELKGRGKRFKENFYQGFDECVNDIYDQVTKEGFDEYAIFGHSMGCAIAFELIKKLKKDGYEYPLYAFFSARYPPHINKKKNIDYLNIDDSKLVEEIFKYGGTDKGVLENRELLQLFLPILRADFNIHESYEYKADPCKFNFDIAVFHGTKDLYVNEKEMGEWGNYTNKKFSMHTYNDGHFFINTYYKDIVNTINIVLKNI